MISDTGMRLAEAAGLLKGNICEDESGRQYTIVRPHP